MDIFATLCHKTIKQVIKINEENDSSLLLMIEESQMSEMLGDSNAGMEYIVKMQLQGFHFHEIDDHEFYDFVMKYKQRRREYTEMFAEAFQCLID